MQAPKKTHNSLERFLNAKLHQYFMDKKNIRRLAENNEVIAETAEYQTPSRASVSLKKNIKVPQRSCTVVDVDINTTEKIKVEVTPDQLWLSANPNICTYPMIADLKEGEPAQ